MIHKALHTCALLKDCKVSNLISACKSQPEYFQTISYLKSHSQENISKLPSESYFLNRKSPCQNWHGLL